MVLFKQIAVNTRLCVKALCPRFADHFNKVFITGFIFTKQYKMISFVIKAVNLIKSCSRSNITLTTDNRLNSGFLCRLVKINHTVHYAVVGDCCGRLPFCFNGVNKFAYAARTVKETIFGVKMKMSESQTLPAFHVNRQAVTKYLFYKEFFGKFFIRIDRYCVIFVIYYFSRLCTDRLFQCLNSCVINRNER